MKILIADDDEITRLLLRSAPMSLGHDAGEASNGCEAWKAWLSGEFPFVISNWMMPDLAFSTGTLKSATRFLHDDATKHTPR